MRQSLYPGYVTNVKDSSWYIDFSKESFKNWMDRTIAKSRFTPETKISEEDNIITLSTCTYEFDNARYVLVGKINKVK